MKKMMAILLCLMMLAAPLQAMAAPGDIMFPYTEEGPLTEAINDYCGIGDTLYMMNYDGTRLYAHKVGDAEPTVYSVTPELAQEANIYRQRRLFSDGERLLTLQMTENYAEDAYTTTAQLCELVLGDGVAEEKQLMDLDWDVFKTEDGYYRYMDNMIAVPGYLVMTTYNDMGYVELYKLDLKTGEFAKSEIEDPYSISYYTDGMLLMQMFDYDKPTQVRFVVYDPATDILQAISALEIEEYQTFSGITCDPATGEVYHVAGGEIFALDLKEGKKGVPITDMALAVYDNAHPVILEGGYYACASYDGYAVRSLNPDEKSDRRLKIRDNCYADEITTAYYEFVNEHGDVSTVLSREYSENSIIEAMMNRESEVDIYVMSGTDANFEAVFDRGYIADFRDSEALMAFADRMNEKLREQFMVNGTFAVMPLGVTYWSPRINIDALEKLGYSKEDVPSSWSEFLDFLIEIQDAVEESGEYTLFDPWTSDYYARWSMFTAIFDSYQDLLSYDPNAVNKNDMIEILQKLDRIDFSRFGQPTEEQTMDENYMPEWNDEKILLNTNVGSGLQGLTSSDYGEVLVMSLLPDSPVFLPVMMEVAFINPYTEDMDLALEFMEKLYEKLDDDTRYTFCQDLSDPVKNPYFEEQKKNMEENIQYLEEMYEKAEAADKQSLEEELKWCREYLADMDRYYWAISESDIAFARENADKILMDGSDWLYSDDSGEAYDLVEQYAQGKIDAVKLMNEIDRKIRMMLMEGY